MSSIQCRLQTPNERVPRAGPTERQSNPSRLAHLSVRSLKVPPQYDGAETVDMPLIIAARKSGQAKRRRSVLASTITRRARHLSHTSSTESTRRPTRIAAAASARADGPAGVRGSRRGSSLRPPTVTLDLSRHDQRGDQLGQSIRRFLAENRVPPLSSWTSCGSHKRRTNAPALLDEQPYAETHDCGTTLYRGWKSFRLRHLKPFTSRRSAPPSLPRRRSWATPSSGSRRRRDAVGVATYEAVRSGRDAARRAVTACPATPR